MIAVMPGASGPDLVPVVGLRADADDVPAAAADLTRHVLGSRLERRTPAGWLVRDPDGEIVAWVTVRGDWIVIGPAGGGQAIDEVASALGDETADRPRFGDARGTRWTLGRLPASADLRMVANPQALAELLAARPNLMSWLAATDLHHLESLGAARTFHPEAVETRIVGRIAQRPGDGGLVPQLARLAPVTGDLERRVPQALLSVEASIDVASWITAAARMVRDAAPGPAAKIAGWIEDFENWSGLRPATDLLPFLGRGVAFAVLPPDGLGSGWPLPRPVLILGIEDEAVVNRFAERWVRFKAGSLAPATGGLLGGRAVHREIAGVQVHEIVVDTVLPGPVPSPAAAIANGVLVASPCSSAVADVLRHEADIADEVPAGAVEVVRIDGAALLSWWRDWTAAVAANGRAVDPGTERVVSAALHLLEDFEPVVGSTRVAADGSFTCDLDLVRPNELRERERE
jgi:hypothetical protein